MAILTNIDVFWEMRNAEVCCEALLLAILATAWLLVSYVSCI